MKKNAIWVLDVDHRGCDIYTCILTHTMEYYSAIKKNEIFAICYNMDESGRLTCLVKKVRQRRQILYNINVHI